MRKDDGTRVVVPRGANANNAGMKLEWASWVFVEGKEVVGAEDGGGRFGCGTCVDEQEDINVKEKDMYSTLGRCYHKFVVSTNTVHTKYAHTQIK